MLSKLAGNTTYPNMFSWRLIAKELIGTALAWGAYWMAATMMQDPVLQNSAPTGLENVMLGLFWATFVVTGITTVIACLKSALPAIIALVISPTLYILNFPSASIVALYCSGIATFIYATTFALYRSKPTSNVNSD